MNKPTLYNAAGKAITFSDPPVQPSRSVMVQPRLESFRRGFMAVLGAMPDPDKLLAREGRDLFDRMMDDPHLAGAWAQVVRRILSREWEVKPFDAKNDQAVEIAAYTSGVLKRIRGLRKGFEHLLEAPTHRYAVVGVDYSRGETLTPRALVSLERRFFRYNAQLGLMVSKGGLFQEAGDYLFVDHVHRQSARYVQGRSILKPCYWSWRFKNAGWEYWATALDRFSVPSLVALFTMADGNLEKAKEWAAMLADELAQVSSGSSAALANAESVSQIGGAKSAEGFDTFLDFCNAELSKPILASTLTLEVGRSGHDRGNTEVHDRVVNDTAAWFGDELAERLTETLVLWTAYLRYGEAALEMPPRFVFDWRRQLSVEEMQGFLQLGVPTSYSALVSDFNVPKPSGEEDVFIAGQPGAIDFSEDVKKKAQPAPWFSLPISRLKPPPRK